MNKAHLSLEGGICVDGCFESLHKRQKQLFFEEDRVKTAAVGKGICSMMRVPMLFILGLVLLSTVAQAQEAGNIVGTVTDPAGAVVSNAKIIITNTDTGMTRTTVSNDTGLYSARDLQIGHYKVQVDAQGFKTYTRTNLTLSVGETVRIDAPLQVGPVGQTVTVEAAALQVQSETNDISQTITEHQIENLATNGRNILQLTALVPGASSQMPDFDKPGAQFQNRTIEFNGMRSDDNNWIIDGGEAYDRGGGGILLVSPPRMLFRNSPSRPATMLRIWAILQAA